MAEVFKSHGKLMITGEYFVLHGAKSLLLPTKFFQDMTVSRLNEEALVLWESYDQNNNKCCLLYTSPSPRDPKTSRMPSSA